MYPRIAYRRTTGIMGVLCAVLAGVVMGKVSPLSTVVGVSVTAMVVGVVRYRKQGLLLCGMLIVALLIGYWRGSVFADRVTGYRTLAKESVLLHVRADTDAVYGDKSQLEFEAGNIEVIEPVRGDLPGRIRVSGFGVAMVYRGDVIAVSGKLYPTRGSKQASISYAELKVVHRGDAVIDSWRRKFVAGMQAALPEPLASFGLGLLIGQKTTLPDDVSDNLSRVGLTHIIAVSGYNLTIIIEAARRLLGRRSKYQATIGSVGLMVVFVLITGFSASIIRAAIVSMLSLCAWYYGRAIRPLLLLLLAAAITALWNPLYIWSDIGWYLSFLAFYGIIVLAPLVIDRLYGIRRKRGVIVTTVIETACAQVMTVPLILYIFHETSPLALLSNIFVVPLVPLAMLLSAVSGLAGTFFSVLAGLISLPTRLLLEYMLGIAEVMSRFSIATVEITFSWLHMVLGYVCVAALSLLLYRRTRRNHGILTDITVES